PASVFNSLQYGFSQAVEVRGGRRLLLSGQGGVDEQERTVGPGLREQTEQALEWLRANGIRHINLDLMYGLPGQSVE
ncbi:hypothetical protein SB766_32145, partial [Pseudomonas sp. SIMBA_077]